MLVFGHSSCFSEIIQSLGMAQLDTYGRVKGCYSLCILVGILKTWTSQSATKYLW